MGRLEKYKLVAVLMAIQIILVKCEANSEEIPSKEGTKNAGPNQLQEYRCLDQDGGEVDWYLAYQLPSSDKRYVFITSAGGRIFTLGKNTLDHPDSMISRTVKQYLTNDPGADNYFVYNDDTSYSNSSIQAEYAHAKGIIVYGQRKGFWLWHSVPRLTPLPGEPFIYPNTNYGQILACFSFDSSPGHNSRHDIETYLASIWAYCRKTPVSGGQCRPFNQAQQFYWFPLPTFNQGMISEVYYKPRELNAEIYQVVANFKNQNWVAQTWHHDTYTDTPNVRNIVEIQIQYLGADNQLITNTWLGRTFDHSKFAMDSSDLENGEFCIGDLNRALTQRLRGGGILCLPPGRGPIGVTVTYQ